MILGVYKLRKATVTWC